MNIFDPDGWFYKWGTKLYDMLIVSLLVIIISIFSLGILTGACLSALFYVTDKVIIHERGYLLKNFFRSFKGNFVQSTIIWMVLLITFGVAGYNMLILVGLKSRGIVILAHYFLFIELTIITVYSFVLIGKFQLSTKEVIIKSLLYGHKHALTTMTILSVIALWVFLIVKVHASFIIIGLGVSSYIISRLIIEMVLPKYIDKEKLTYFSD